MKHSRKSHVNFNSAENKFLNELNAFSAKVFVDNDLIKEWIRDYRAEPDAEILNRILSQVTRLIMFIARKYKTNDIDIRDPIIEAIYGVIEAVNKYYNLDSNQKFITYIKIIIERRIKDTCDKYKQAVELPKNILSKQGKLKKRNSKDAIIYSKINYQKVFEIRNYVNDVVYTDTSLNYESLVYDINWVLNVLLTSNERYVIISLFGLNNSIIRPIESIADDLSISQQTVRDLKLSAFKKLKSNDKCLVLLSKYLEDFN